MAINATVSIIYPIQVKLFYAKYVVVEAGMHSRGSLNITIGREEQCWVKKRSGRRLIEA